MYAKITKALAAALMLVGVSTALITDASARYHRGGWYRGHGSYMYARHNPTNTNGF